MSITITNEGNMQLMSRYPNGYFDLAIVDPEYGIGEAGKNHKSRNTLVRQKDGKTMRRCPSANYVRKEWDNKPAGIEYFEELKRVSINIIVFGANYFSSIMSVSKPPRRNEYDAFINQHPTGFIIWDKVNGTNDFSDCEIIYTSFNRPTIIIYYMWAGMMQGKSIANGTVMIGNKSLNEKRIHPTQKPVMIYKWLLNNYAKLGYNILDTHLGSGSIAIASHDYKFDLTACELDADYFNSAVVRLEKHQSQLKMFA